MALEVRPSPRAYLILAIALLLVTALVQLSMGRHLISKSGRVSIWSPVTSPELSQQVADAYSFSHILHGILFYAAIRAVGKLRGRVIPFGTAVFIVVFLECSWEIIENTPFVIERYRRAALAAGYYGDTILNSFCDILFAVGGFFLAARLPIWATIAVILVIELGLLLGIRDNLTLNVLNLIHPFESIQRWQSARGF